MMSPEQFSVIDTTAFADLSNFVIEARNLLLDLMLEASAAYFVLIDWVAVANPTVAATVQTAIASATSVAAAAAGNSVLEQVINQVRSVAFVEVEPQAGVACVEIADQFACLNYLTGFQAIAAVAVAAAVILKYYSEDPTVADAYLGDCFVEPLTAVAVVVASLGCQAALAISADACQQCCFVDQLTDSAVYLQHQSVVQSYVAPAVAVTVEAAEASLTADSLVFVVDEYQHSQTAVAVAVV